MITFNGRALPTDRPGDVETLVFTQHGSDRGVAVALNGAVLPRSRWADHTLVDGDVVDILCATQGG